MALTDNRSMKSPGLLRRLAQSVSLTIAGVTPQTWFGPMQPLQPMAPPGTKGRQFDYLSGFNLQYIPRSSERISFGRLKQFAADCDIMRIVLETRKDQFEGLDWDIVPKELLGQAKGKRPSSSKYESKITEIKKFFEMPDKRHDWQQWARMINDQQFVIDATSIEPVMTRGGDLYSLELIDGATISPKLDADGRMPMPPSVAYQQILKGIPASNYAANELIYYPKNPRVDHVYGFSRVEQIVHYAEMSIARMQQQLDYFAQGNIPDGLIEGPASMSVDQLKSWQQYWDAIFSGNIGQRRHAWWVPQGTKFTPTKTDPAQDIFDEWLARLICYCFSTSPQPLLKMMNRATAESAQEEAIAEGLRPDMVWWTRLMNRIIAIFFDSPDLEFIWDEDTEYDPVKKATIDQIYFRNAIKTRDEIRDSIGLDPLGGSAGTAMYATATGLIDPDNPPPPPGTVLPGAAGAPQAGSPPAGGAKVGPKGQPLLGGPAAPKNDAGKDAKKGMASVSISRVLLNHGELASWAKVQGIDLPGELSITVAYSHDPIDFTMIPEGTATVLVEGPGYTIEDFGEGPVLVFASDEFKYRIDELASMGMVSDQEKSYIPLGALPVGKSMTAVQPYAGDLLFGPEEFAPTGMGYDLSESGTHFFDTNPEGGGYRKMSLDELNAAAAMADRDPTDAQIIAGNYRKGHIEFQGIQISIENEAGSTRRGVGPDGKKWESTLPAHYGYILRTVGADEEQVDVYVGQNPEAPMVWIIDQADLKDSDFDEHKCFLGFNSFAEVQQTYLNAFSDGKGHARIGGVASMPVATFKDWLKNGDTKSPLTRKSVTTGTGLVHYDLVSDQAPRPGNTIISGPSLNTNMIAAPPWPVNAPSWKPGVAKRSIDAKLIRMAARKATDPRAIVEPGPQVGDWVTIESDTGAIDNAPWTHEVVASDGNWRIQVKDDDRWYDLDPSNLDDVDGGGKTDQHYWTFTKGVRKNSGRPFPVVADQPLIGTSIRKAKRHPAAPLDSAHNQAQVKAYAKVIHQAFLATRKHVAEQIRNSKLGKSNDNHDDQGRFASGSGGSGPGSAAFKQWFGDSKVVDAKGEPLVVYHGSPTKGIGDKLDPNATPVRRGSDPAAVYFTSSAETAISYAGRGGGVTAAYLRIENPLDITKPIAAGQRKGLSFGDAKREALTNLDRSKHDGIIFQGNSHNPAEYAVFQTDQIRPTSKASKLAKADDDPFWDEAGGIADHLDLSSLKVIVEQTEEIGASVAGESGRVALGHFGWGEKDDLVNQIDQRATDWAKTRSAELVGMRYDRSGNLVPSNNPDMAIDEPTRNMVRQIIYEGLQTGSTRSEIAYDLENGTENADYPFSEERANLIASTEIARAHSQGALISYKIANENGVPTKKEWLTNGDDPCDDCQGNEDQGPIELDDDFDSGDDAPPGHPRCRCALVPYLEDGDQGMNEDSDEDED